MNYATRYPSMWRWFFVASVAVVAWSIGYGFLHKPSPGILTQLLSATLGICGLVPLHGYVWQRAHRPKWLWRVMFWFSTVSIALTFVAGVAAIVANHQWALLALLAALLAPGVLYLFALEQYVNRSAHLWS